MSTSPAKPATLQINSRGAWRNVCDFDVADGAAAAHVMEAAATLVAYSLGKASARIVKVQDGYPSPLMVWSESEGWKPWSRG